LSGPFPNLKESGQSKRRKIISATSEVALMLSDPRLRRMPFLGCKFMLKRFQRSLIFYLRMNVTVLSCDYAVMCKHDVNWNIMNRPTIEQLEQILASEEEVPIEILPNGEVRARGESSAQELGGRKPLTMRENLGGEYAKEIR